MTTSPLKQIAALPVVETADGPLVLLITTRARGRWTIPRGWAKPGVSDAELAAREAFEEAGVEGDIGAEPIGHFLYTKRLHLFSWARCDVEVYKLAVGCQLLDWPEKASRKTKWVGLDEAAAMIRDTGLAGLLRDFARRRRA
jgi:8-oxo-dGTP pyrophosphatase MutT (NUDIX family)